MKCDQDDTPPINPAQLAAELQALTIALHIGGLDGLRSGEVKVKAPTQKEAGDE